MGTFLLFGRTLLALSIVLVLVWGFARLARHGQATNIRRRLSRPAGGEIEIVSKRSLSRTSAVALVSVGNRALLVGITPQSVSLISEVQLEELTPPTPPAQNDTPWMAVSGQTPTAWDAFISTLREWTVRS